MTKETILEVIPFGKSVIIPKTTIVNTSHSGRTYLVDVTVLRKFSYDGVPVCIIYGTYVTLRGNTRSYSEPLNASEEDYEKLCAKIPNAKYTSQYPEFL